MPIRSDEFVDLAHRVYELERRVEALEPRIHADPAPIPDAGPTDPHAGGTMHPSYGGVMLLAADGMVEATASSEVEALRIENARLVREIGEHASMVEQARAKERAARIDVASVRRLLRRVANAIKEHPTPTRHVIDTTHDRELFFDIDAVLQSGAAHGLMSDVPTKRERVLSRDTLNTLRAALGEYQRRSREFGMAAETNRAAAAWEELDAVHGNVRGCIG